jgi:hypothetical protein
MRSEEFDFLGPRSAFLIALTDRVRFELTIRGYRIPVFETGAFSLSATCPRPRNIVGLVGGVNETLTMRNED